MKIKQVSVFLENKVGHLRTVAEELKRADINIRAISLADSENFGVLRLVVEDPDKTHSVLREAKHAVKETEVIAVEVPDEPGGLSDILKTFEDNGINIEYMYSVLEKKSDKAVMILRVEDIEDVIGKLEKQNMKLLSSEELHGAL